MSTAAISIALILAIVFINLADNTLSRKNKKDKRNYYTGEDDESWFI